MTEPLPPPPVSAPSHWGRWLLLALALLLLAALGWLKWGLDPWLRRKLEQQVSAKSHGQYALTVAGLQTQLLARTLHLRGLSLRPATPTLADTLPRLRLRLARLDLSGVGLLALLRGHTVPVDSLTLDSLRLEVAALARRPAPHPTPPLYQQRPVRLGYLALRRIGGSFGPTGAPVVELPLANVSGRDLLFTPAGAADTQRLGFAASWQATLHRLGGRLGGHTIKAQLLTFSSAKQFFNLDSLRIAPPAPGQGKPGAVRVAMTLPRLRVAGLRAATWQHTQHFIADSAWLKNPRLTFRPPAKAPPPLWKLLRPLFRQADLQHFVIADGYLAMVGVELKPEARHIVGEGHSLHIDSAASLPAARRVLYARGWTGHTGRITAVFEPPLYPASIEHIALNTHAQTMRLTGLALRPTLTPAQLNLHWGYQMSQLQAHIPAIWARGFDFVRLSADSHLHIERVVVEHPYLKVSSDGRGPINKQPSIMTPESVRKLRAHLNVRRLDLREGTLAAAYRSPRTPLVGTFAVNRLNATLRNITNDPHRMTLAHPLTGSASGYLQNKCRGQVQLSTCLLDPLGRQHFWGSFGAAPFAILNPIVKPTRLLAFKSGNAQRLTFDEHLDRHHITGQMLAEYTNLRFEFLGYKQGEVKKTLLGRVKSGLVNGLVIRDQNPRPDGKLVVGDLRTDRQLQFSVFTAWRQGLLRGLLHSTGVPGKLAQKYSQQSDEGPLPGPAPAQPTSQSMTRVAQGVRAAPGRP